MTAAIVGSICDHLREVLEAVVGTKKAIDDSDLVERDSPNPPCWIVAGFQICRARVDCHNGKQDALACHCIVNIGARGGIHLRLLRLRQTLNQRFQSVVF